MSGQNLDAVITKQIYFGVLKNFNTAVKRKLTFNRKLGVNKISKGLNALLKSSAGLNRTEKRMYVNSGIFDLFQGYFRSRNSGDEYSISGDPNGPLLECVLDMFEGAQLSDYYINDGEKFEEKHLGPTFQMLEDYFFHNYNEAIHYSFTPSDLKFNKVIMNDHAGIMDHKEWKTIFTIIFESTKQANTLAIRKLKYLAEEYVLDHNVDTNNYLIFRAKIVDYGSSLAFRDQDWILPKGRAQRFVEQTLKIKQEDLY